MGTPDFAVPVLDALVAAGHDVVRVVTQPDRPKGRGKKLTSPPVAVRARELGIEVGQPKSVRVGSFQKRTQDLAPDIAVVVAYGRILPQEVLDIPTHGVVNVHASLLPRWRGSAPIQWAIASGDRVTGVSTQRVEVGLDTGPLYGEIQTTIGNRETAAELHDRLSLLGAELAVKTLANLTSPTPQDEAHATHAPMLSRADGEIHWTKSAIVLDQRLRGFTPWPGGYVIRGNGEKLKVISAHPVQTSGTPGKILALDPLTIGCKNGGLVLTQVQAAGKRSVSGRDFANGAHLCLGDLL